MKFSHPQKRTCQGVDLGCALCVVISRRRIDPAARCKRGKIRRIFERVHRLRFCDAKKGFDTSTHHHPILKIAHNISLQLQSLQRKQHRQSQRQRHKIQSWRIPLHQQTPSPNESEDMFWYQSRKVMAKSRK